MNNINNAYSVLVSSLSDSGAGKEVKRVGNESSSNRHLPALASQLQFSQFVFLLFPICLRIKIFQFKGKYDYRR